MSKAKRKPRKTKPVIIQGWDISMNHGAMVQLKDGELDDVRYYCKTATSAKLGGDKASLLPKECYDPKKQPDRDQKNLNRLSFVFCQFDSWLAAEPDYVGLEDYALGMARQAHYIGEVGGVARMQIAMGGYKTRWHDPTSVKMFVAHRGHATKDVIERAVLRRWGQDFGRYNPPPNPKTKRQNRETSEDIADAYGIAQMLWTEWQLRNGRLEPRDLHPKELQVFNRITKANPLSLWDREWTTL